MRFRRNSIRGSGHGRTVTIENAVTSDSTQKITMEVIDAFKDEMHQEMSRLKTSALRAWPDEGPRHPQSTGYSKSRFIFQKPVITNDFKIKTWVWNDATQGGKPYNVYMKRTKKGPVRVTAKNKGTQGQGYTYPYSARGKSVGGKTYWMALWVKPFRKLEKRIREQFVQLVVAYGMTGRES